MDRRGTDGSPHNNNSSSIQHGGVWRRLCNLYDSLSSSQETHAGQGRVQSETVAGPHVDASLTSNETTPLLSPRNHGFWSYWCQSGCLKTNSETQPPSQPEGVITQPPPPPEPMNMPKALTQEAACSGDPPRGASPVPEIPSQEAGLPVVDKGKGPILERGTEVGSTSKRELFREAQGMLLDRFSNVEAVKDFMRTGKTEDITRLKLRPFLDEDYPDHNSYTYKITLQGGIVCVFKPGAWTEVDFYSVSRMFGLDDKVPPTVWYTFEPAEKPDPSLRESRFRDKTPEEIKKIHMSKLEGSQGSVQLWLNDMELGDGPLPDNDANILDYCAWQADRITGLNPFGEKEPRFKHANDSDFKPNFNWGHLPNFPYILFDNEETFSSDVPDIPPEKISQFMPSPELLEKARKVNWEMLTKDTMLDRVSKEAFLMRLSKWYKTIKPYLSDGDSDRDVPACLAEAEAIAERWRGKGVEPGYKETYPFGWQESLYVSRFVLAQEVMARG